MAIAKVSIEPFTLIEIRIDHEIYSQVISPHKIYWYINEVWDKKAEIFIL